MPARYTIGIDLGTSNCALSYVDTTRDDQQTELLEIPQYESLGKWRADAVLPSFCYFLTDDEAREFSNDEQAASDWSKSRVVGLWAREQASLSPERVAFSAKSWLCHRGVDRESKLLPWQSTVLASERKLSPVDVSAAYLSYLRTVWDQTIGSADKQSRFDKQNIVITAPASFDADAQRLTLQAAERAGYPASTRLLEEPQAAFYAWLERHASPSAITQAFPQIDEKPMLALVCDIGGGTSDFSLFEITKAEDETQLPAIRRLAVSEHILLGGDNLDLALAKRFETELTNGGSLSTSAWAQLIAQCRALKERILADSVSEQSSPCHVSVTEAGSSLFGSARSAELPAGEILSLLLEGFFPDCASDASPDEHQSGIREMGLPYAQDSAITRHLAGFLRGRRVDSILFNGGTVASPLLQQRLQKQIGQWQSNALPAVLVNDEPHLAVARGAAYYRMNERARSGLTISGGAAHAIYLEIEGAAPKKAKGKKKRKNTEPARGGVCILPQGTEIETPLRLIEPELQLLVNRPVRLQAWTSPSRPEDKVGSVVDLNGTDFHRLPPMQTMAQLSPKASKPADGKVAVHLLSEVNNLGLLQVLCESVRRLDGQQRRWSLEFNLREQISGDSDTTETRPEDSNTGVSSEDLKAAATCISHYFSRQSNSLSQSKNFSLLKELETKLHLKRKEWNTALLRQLWEPIGESITLRDLSPEHELAWLIAAGFSLRPGYGHPLDEFRMQRLWFLHELGLANAANKAILEQLFVLWRRTAGGLQADQQMALYEQWQDRIYDHAKSAHEPLRMAGALEWLPTAERERLATHCVQIIEQKSDRYCDHATWALGRLLTRTPLYAGESAILGSEIVSSAFTALSSLDWSSGPLKSCVTTFALAARRLDHRDHDLPGELRERIFDKLKASNASHTQLQNIREFAPLGEKDRQQLFGETLPVGLHW